MLLRGRAPTLECSLQFARIGDALAGAAK